VSRQTPYFFQRQKSKKKGLLLRRALLARLFFSFYSHWIYRPEHYTSAPFTGPLPLAPALRCSVVVSGECSIASFLCSNPVTFKPEQKTTALEIVVIT
jgi:hypothetical protein